MIVISRRNSGRRNAVIAALVPMAFIVPGYVALRGAASGDWTTGLRYRAYTAFAQGEGVAFAYRSAGARDFYREGEEATARLYGTRRENENSIVRAVRNNPGAYAARLWQNAKVGAYHFMTTYGEGFAAALLLFALRGVYALVREKQKRSPPR
ncbi:MAG: hypothetical protein M5R36_11605 [Deltaproteobacteria bacterium]|nr:hypothetical protein [Deltaproteobacteria bacterium]